MSPQILPRETVSTAYGMQLMARWLALPLTLQFALLTLFVAAGLYLAFFTPISAFHDVMHPIRHASTLVPCH